MQNIRRLLVTVEVALLAVYVVLAAASLVTGRFHLELLGLPPLLIFSAAMIVAPPSIKYLVGVPIVALGIYFVVTLAIPIASIIIFKRKYLAINIALLVGALVSVCVLGTFFPQALNHAV
jgi:hypothetical protein